MLRILSVVLVLLFTAAAQAQASQTPVSLRPQWQAGQSATYEFWDQRLQRVTIEGHTSETSVNATGQVHWAVQRVHADGSYTCAMTLKWMSATMTAGGQTFSNDSRKASGDLPAMHDLLKAMAGVTLTVKVANDGTVTSVKGMQAMKRNDEVAAMIPTELDFIETAADLAVLPNAPAEIQPGQTWDARLRWSHDLGEMIYDATYKLDSVRMFESIPLAHVSASAKLRLEADQEALPPGMPKMDMDVRLIEGDWESEVFFDLQRHEAAGRNALNHQVVQITMKIPDRRRTIRWEQTTQSQTLRVSEGD